ncbi:hypothetical protein CP533_5560 [Ophiocordyceps camponoti-saundersi (nom. inval.)]|nr:hypothetical protein CP533_5560 [Ophiocordyceps camponoti-saundersi (nom. inval.)]
MPSVFPTRQSSTVQAEDMLSEDKQHQSMDRLLGERQVDDYTLKSSTAAAPGSRQRHPLFRIYLYILHGLLIAVFFWFWGQTHFGPRLISSEGRSWSPANRFVEYEVDDRVVAIHGQHSVYAGPPSTEQEEAWDALVQHSEPNADVMRIKATYFNLSRDELERTGEPTDRIVEVVAGGYMASLGVYHEIHCLRELRCWIYRENYHPNITEGEARNIVGHLGQPAPPAMPGWTKLAD